MRVCCALCDRIRIYSPYLDFILSHFSSVSTPTTCLLNINFNIIFQAMCSRWSVFVVESTREFGTTTWTKIWVSKFFMAKDYICCCGLVREPRVEKITISGIYKCINYCEIFIVYTQFTNVVADSIIQSGGPPVGDPWINIWESEVVYAISRDKSGGALL
jgi:hypothetical protein